MGKYLPTLVPHPGTSSLLPGARKRGVPQWTPSFAERLGLRCPQGITDCCLHGRNPGSKWGTPRSSPQCSPPPPPPHLFLKRVKCTEGYREEHNAPPGVVMISPRSLQLCFLKSGLPGPAGPLPHFSRRPCPSPCSCPAPSHRHFRGLCVSMRPSLNNIRVSCVCTLTFTVLAVYKSLTVQVTSLEWWALQPPPSAPGSPSPCPQCWHQKWAVLSVGPAPDS